MGVKWNCSISRRRKIALNSIAVERSPPHFVGEFSHFELSQSRQPWLAMLGFDIGMERENKEGEDFSDDSVKVSCGRELEKSF